jgi:hypothetical protein
MPCVITAADRASFRRCRRQWDFGAETRQNLEPREPPAAPDLDRALRDALAVYYYPGMWDWDRAVRLPLVVQGLERALARQRKRGRDHADAAVRYRGRIDLMAVDARDAYWIVRHRLVDGDWPPTAELVADEETAAACWAWKQSERGRPVDLPAPAAVRPGQPGSPG